MRERFIDDLNRLETLNFDMFRMGEQSLQVLQKLITEKDRTLCNRISEIEGAMDEKKKQVEGLAMALILREQPVAQDLALITASLGVVVDLERISDQSRDIAFILDHPGQLENKEMDSLAKLTKQAYEMFRLARRGFVEKTKCRDLLESMDDEMDQGFEDIKKALKENPHAQDLDLLLVAKYLERIGDHCVNIGEWVDASLA